MNTPSFPRGPVLSRRQAFRAGATAMAAVALPVTMLADARSAAALPVASAAPVAVPLAQLPRLFGTPTDLARQSEKTTWTRDADGTPLVFDRQHNIWKKADQTWERVLGYGTAYLSRWGRPSGASEAVLVMGAVPKAVPTTTTSATPPPPPTSRSTVTSTDGGKSSSGPNRATTTRSSTPTTATTTGPQLAATGINVADLGFVGGALLTAGVAVLALRRRRMDS